MVHSTIYREAVVEVGGGTSNVRMLRASLPKAPGPNGFGSVTITYGFGAPVEGPFVQTVEAVLSDNVQFNFSFFPNPDGLTGVVTCTAVEYDSGQPTDAEFPKDVLIRVEPFVAS